MNCKNCGKEVQENWALCPFCGTKIEKKKLCSNCGAELQPNWMMCPFCGQKANAAPVPIAFGATLQNSATSILPNVDGFSSSNSILPDDFGLDLVADDIVEAQQRQQNDANADYQKKLNLARIACIRKNFSKAKEIYEELLLDNPEDVNAYVGFVRIVTQNYTVFIGDEIDEAVQIAQEIAGQDMATLDADYANYAAIRPAKVAEHLAEEKRLSDQQAKKAAEEAERRRLEQERKSKAEAEAKRLEAIRIAQTEAMQKAAEEATLFASEIAIYAYSYEIDMKGTLTAYMWNTQKVEIPPCVTKIGSKAFSTGLDTSTYVPPRYHSAEEMEIPAQITEIADRAFLNCVPLKKLTFAQGSKLQRIGNFAFQYCNNLQRIKVPMGVTHIGEGAFSDCTRLSYIELPPSVKSVGRGAFKNIGKDWGCTIAASETLDLSLCEIPAKVVLQLY